MFFYVSLQVECKINKTTMKELPKFHQTCIPILDILSSGELISHREMLRRVIEKYYKDLPQELLDQKTKSGANLISNRIAWGKSYLKQGKYIQCPERGMVQITERGRKALSNRESLEKSSESSDTIDFYVEDRISSFVDHTEMRNASPQDLIDRGFGEIEMQVKNDLLERLKQIDPYYFEKVILILLKKMGYGDFIETSRSNDGGIDGIINEDQLGLDKIYIQAKRYGDNKVREKDIRNFIGAMSGDTTKGVFVTTTDFDQGAIKKAHDAHHTIILINGSKLVDLMHQYNVGVQIKESYEVKIVDEDFFEGE